MNGYSRHTKYRAGIYRKRQIKTVLLTAVAVLALVLVALLILGSILIKRANTEAPPSREETETASEEKTDLPSPPSLRAMPILLETTGSDTLVSRLNSLISSGYTAASIPLNRGDGALLYHSALTTSLELTVAGEYSVTIESAVNRATEKGIYLSGTYFLNEMAGEDDLVRSVALAKSAAVVAEALRAGIDEVLLILPSLTHDQIPLLLQFADSVRALSSEGSLGCALPPSLLTEENGGESIAALSEKYQLLALDLTHSDINTPTEYVEATMASSGVLFYLLRYEMRVLLPEVIEDTDMAALITLVESNWTKNWQILSSVTANSPSTN